MAATVLTVCLLTAAAANAAAAAAAEVTAGAETEAVLDTPAEELLMASQCPCAYVERGGFWDSEVARSLGVAEQVYAETRCSCAYETNCDKRWRASEKSLTMKWLGAQGICDNEIQLQFCSQIYPPGTPQCDVGASAFTLKQVGWWVDLLAVRCRCGSGAPATIRRFRYIEPLLLGDGLRSQVVDFACGKPPSCATLESPCYREYLNPAGLRTGGRVLCACPSGSYCPIYRDGGPPRVPVNGTSGQVSGYKLQCQPEP